MIAHLWQSTLCAAAAGLLALVLRPNRAQIRYWLWFAASLKFLLPMALLVSLGTLVPRHPTASPAPWVTIVEQVGEPPVSFPDVGHAAIAQTAARRLDWSWILLGVWGCGFTAVSLCWLDRWRRVHVLARTSLKIEFPVPVQSVAGLVEPGIFGIIRPVLLLPEGIEERLSPAQMRAILAHELCHVHRRDNLAAAIHMVVQATFWFHPLVWWIGARLIEERERACDEEVLRMGVTPDVYAAGILTVCRLYVESRLACVSGVTGSNLRRRVESIMKSPIAVRLTLLRKALLASAAAALVVGPVAVGMWNAPLLRAQDSSSKGMTFEAASVKPVTPPAGMTVEGERTLVRKGSGISIPKNTGGPGTGDPGRIHYPLISLKALLIRAWDSYYEIQGPGWLDTQTVQVDATMPPATTKPQFQQMLRNLIAERFALKYHVAAKEVTGYTLIVGKNGIKMKESADQTGGEWARTGPPTSSDAYGFPVIPPSPGHWLGISSTRGANRIQGQQVSMAEFAKDLEHNIHANVTDETGLTKRYDLKVIYTETGQPGGATLASQPAGLPQGVDPLPDVFSALQSQLGLKLEPKKLAVEVFVIDHMEKTPAGN